MNQRIIFEAVDGGVSIVTPTGDVPIADLVPMMVPDGAAWRVVDASAIPEDRGDRDAWRWADFAG